jgi:TolB-like protein
LAQDLSRPAREAHLGRIAVLPFTPADQTPPVAGRILAEWLLTELVRVGDVAVVERAMLEKLIAERGLSLGRITGAGDRRGVGRSLSVDGLVVGSFLARGKELLVRARLIEVETGLVVAASEGIVSRRWPRPPDAPAAAEPLFVPEYCVGAAEQVDHIEGDILDLKARYWALQLRRGISLSALRVFPGSDISDPDLQWTLYDRMHDWYAQGRIPELSPAEMRRLLTLDRRAFLLHSGCQDPAAG